MADILNNPAGTGSSFAINHDYTAAAKFLIVGVISGGASGDFRGGIQGSVDTPTGKQIRGVASAGSRDGTFSAPDASFTMIVFGGETFRVEVTDDFSSNLGSAWQASANVYSLS